MVQLTLEIVEFLNAGGTLVVPTRQRAVAVRIAHTGAMLVQRRRVWTTPDILPWQAWIEREFDAARARGAPVPRRLRAAEEWLLWRESVRFACAGLDVLLPDDLIDAVRGAVTLLTDWDLAPAPATASVEAGVLQRARQAFDGRCQALGAVGTTHWRRCLEYAAPLAPARLLGFRGMGTGRLAFLAAHGVTPWLHGESAQSTRVESGSMVVVNPPDPDAEIQAAAHWCRMHLQADPAARLLVVLPALDERRHAVLRAFSQTLAPEQIFARTADDGREAADGGRATADAGGATADSGSESGNPAPIFALEGGQPLASYPIAATALQLFALAAGALEFAQWSALLRSPYIRLGSAAQCLRIDLWLREQNVTAVMLTDLVRLGSLVDTALDEGCGALLRRLFSVLATPGRAVETPAYWARRFATMLQECGWPGAVSLRSDEQQLRLRFDALLGEFAALGDSARSLSLSAAGEVLQRLAAAIAYTPASDDVPVTISAYQGDPIVRYDGVWVGGLSADVFPAPAAPDALIPLPMQRAAGIAQADASGELQLARQALLDWRQTATQLVLSWPAADGDMRRDPSPLLAELLALDPTAASLAAEAPGLRVRVQGDVPPDLAHAVRSQGRFESWSDDTGAPWPAGQRLPGGTQALELVAWCPFRAYAQLRLSARPLKAPASGIDPRLRGGLLHAALEHFWRATPDSTALRVRPPAAQAGLVRRCLEQASQTLLARSAACIEPRLLQLELLRAESVLLLLLDWERRRIPFSVQAVEWPQVLSIDDWSVKLRLDRVDRLEDGSLAVIDYKTGAVESFDAFAPRPTRPQLLAYAMAAGQDVAAVAMAYLGREGQTLRGVADRDDRLPGVPGLGPPMPPWQALVAQWRTQLASLAHEFTRGYAAVRPLPHACERCHLQMLCRVDSASIASAAQAAGTQAEPDDGD